MPRPLALLSAAAVVIAASACASAGSRTSHYARELEQLEQGCTARGGILIPVDIGRQVGRPQTDYACKINGGGSRLPH